MVAGTALLDPRIVGAAVATGLVGPRPVGSTRRRSILNIDWRLLRGKGPLSLDLAFESFSGRVANTLNTLAAPARDGLSLGMRYRFRVDRLPAALRVQLTNVFDSYGWQVAPSGAFTYTRRRALLGDLRMDF